MTRYRSDRYYSIVFDGKVYYTIKELATLLKKEPGSILKSLSEQDASFVIKDYAGNQVSYTPGMFRKRLFLLASVPYNSAMAVAKVLGCSPSLIHQKTDPFTRVVRLKAGQIKSRGPMTTDNECVINGVRYANFSQAERDIGTAETTIAKYAKRGELSKLPKSSTFGRKPTAIKTPLGEFDSISLAAQAHEVTVATIYRRLEASKSSGGDYQKLPAREHNEPECTHEG